MERCSRTGPRLSAGKNVRAPTMTMTDARSMENIGVVTGKVPGEGGTVFLPARLPAMASMGMIMRKRPQSMAAARETLNQFVLELRPAKAEPLLPAPEVKA